MKTMYTGDTFRLDGMNGTVITAEITEDDAQFIIAEVDGCRIPMIISNECMIPNDWTDVCQTYEDADSIKWVLAEIKY